MPTETHERPYPSLTSLRAAMPGLGPPLDSLGLVGGRTQPVLGAWGPGGGQGQQARRPLRKEELEWLEEQVWRPGGRGLRFPEAPVSVGWGTGRPRLGAGGPRERSWSLSRPPASLLRLSTRRLGPQVWQLRGAAGIGRLQLE